MFAWFIGIQYRMGRLTAEQVRALALMDRITQQQAQLILSGV